MSFLDDIRKQPRHHREIMFGLCVITTISLVGLIWYSSFEKNLYALLNPGQDGGQRNLAQQKESEPSMFGGVYQVGKDLKAAFYNLFNLTSSDKENLPNRQASNAENAKASDFGRVYTLPLSGKR